MLDLTNDEKIARLGIETGMQLTNDTHNFEVLALSVTYSEAMEEEKRRRVIIDYTNYRGERSARTICHPMTLEFMATDWHPAPQWILYAFDLKKNEMRGFAMKCIHSWDTVKA
jgi:hypothetical protein